MSDFRTYQSDSGFGEVAAALRGSCLGNIGIEGCITFNAPKDAIHLAQLKAKRRWRGSGRQRGRGRGRGCGSAELASKFNRTNFSKKKK